MLPQGPLRRPPFCAGPSLLSPGRGPRASACCLQALVPRPRWPTPQAPATSARQRRQRRGSGAARRRRQRAWRMGSAGSRRLRRGARGPRAAAAARGRTASGRGGRRRAGGSPRGRGRGSGSGSLGGASLPARSGRGPAGRGSGAARARRKVRGEARGACRPGQRMLQPALRQSPCVNVQDKVCSEVCVVTEALGPGSGQTRPLRLPTWLHLLQGAARPRSARPGPPCAPTSLPAAGMPRSGRVRRAPSAAAAAATPGRGGSGRRLQGATARGSLRQPRPPRFQVCLCWRCCSRTSSASAPFLASFFVVGGQACALRPALSNTPMPNLTRTSLVLRPRLRSYQAAG